jgi:glutathione S-transferase
MLTLYVTPSTCALASMIALEECGAAYEVKRIDFKSNQQRGADDPFEFARVQEFNSYLCSTVHVAHAHRMRGYRWANDDTAIEAMKRKVPQSVGEAYALIETGMFRGPWVMGGHYTLCDPYLFTLSQWLEDDGVDPAGLPKIAAHRERMRQRPAVQRALTKERGTGI